MPKKNPNAGVLFGTDIAVKNMEHMGYLGNYRDLGQAAAEIQARLPAQLHARCGAAGRAARHWPSDSIRRFGCGRIMQFPPGCMATRLLLVERQLGEAGSSVRSSPRCFSPLPARRKRKPLLLLLLPFSMSTRP